MRDMTKDYILITGATGNLGQLLVNRLINHKKNLIIFSSGLSGNNPEKLFNNKDIKFCDLTNFSKIIEKYNPKLMINLQVKFSYVHDLALMNEMMDANIYTPIKLLEICSKNGLQRLISATSAAIYQDNLSLGFDPQNFFAATKQAFSDLAFSLSKVNEFAYDEVLIYETFSFNDQRKKILSTIIDCIKSGEKLKMSPGNQIVDVSYADTVAAGICQFTDDNFISRVGKKNTYFASSGNRLTLKELAARCENILNKKLNVEWGGLPYRNHEIMNPKEPIKNMNICDQEDIDLIIRKLIESS